MLMCGTPTGISNSQGVVSQEIIQMVCNFDYFDKVGEVIDRAMQRHLFIFGLLKLSCVFCEGKFSWDVPGRWSSCTAARPRGLWNCRGNFPWCPFDYFRGLVLGRNRFSLYNNFRRNHSPDMVSIYQTIMIVENLYKIIGQTFSL